MLVAEVQHRGQSYIIHFKQPSDQVSVKKHYFSFLWSSHGFTQDVVKIFRAGEPERNARLAPESKSELKIQFNSDDDEALRLYDLARVLLVLKRDYWWYFWLNSQKWSWPYTACKNLCAQRGAAVEKIEVDDLEGPLGSAEVTSEFLKENCEGWKHAELRKYCKLPLSQIIAI